MGSFFFSLISLLGWGLADVFYKLGSDGDDKFSYLKIAVWVGLTMGVSSLVLLLFFDNSLSVGGFFPALIKYSPASLSYIVSMVIGYAGLRYLELSIVSPVQNASGAFSVIVMILFFLLLGNSEAVKEMFSLNAVNILNVIGTVAIVSGVIALAVAEKKAEGLIKNDDDKKYRLGVIALLFPLLYCLFDTIGTAADGIILSDEFGLSLTEIDVLILYGLTFFVAGICCYIFLWIKEKKPYNPFTLKEVKTKGVASVAEEFGQIFYVYAMAKNPILAAPMISSYCIVSVLLSRIFLKEKLNKPQYACIISVIVGILLLGISEGLAEI